MKKLNYGKLMDAANDGDEQLVEELVKGKKKTSEIKDVFFYVCEFCSLEILQVFFKYFNWSKEIANNVL